MNQGQKFASLIGSFLCWFAVFIQCYLMLQNRVTSIPEAMIRFFSYYTILTNTLCAVYYTIWVFGKPAGAASFIRRSSSATAILVYIMVVGLVYQIILRHTWDPQGLQKLIDELLHTLNPLFFLVYWWVFVRKASRLRWTMLGSWLIYPFLYLVFILLRGMASGFYPYPFVDAGTIGYTKVFMNSLILLLVFSFLSLLFISLTRIKNPVQTVN